MANEEMAAQIAKQPGFIAALDQSGGSTPRALRLYGIPDDAYQGDDEMFRLMHEMRVRIMTAPSFVGSKVIGAILFERTMSQGVTSGKLAPSYLWHDRGVVPFVKVDSGLEPERDGVRLMKPMPDLDALLSRASGLGVFGTKMRSVIHLPSKGGIAAIVAQQFEVATRIAAQHLVPILEPEILIGSPGKREAEAMLRDELAKGLEGVPASRQVILKLTLPEEREWYASLVAHPRVMRVVALSGGYTRDDACRRLTENHGLIASFSRALTDGLTESMTDDEFEAALAASIDEIFEASTRKSPPS